MRRLNLIRHLNCTLKLAETIQPLIVEAEKFTHFSGEEKKQYKDVSLRMKNREIDILMGT